MCVLRHIFENLENFFGNTDKMHQKGNEGFKF